MSKNDVKRSKNHFLQDFMSINSNETIQYVIESYKKLIREWAGTLSRYKKRFFKNFQKNRNLAVNLKTLFDRIVLYNNTTFKKGGEKSLESHSDFFLFP